MKKSMLILLSAVLLLYPVGCSKGVSMDEYEALQSEYDALKAENATLKNTNQTQSRAYISLRSEYESFKSEASEFLALREDEQEEVRAKTHAARLAAEEAERKAEEEAKRQAEQRKAEEEARRQAEEAQRLAEEALGYETGITFKDLSRTPDNYIGKKVTFSGRVLQVLEGSFSNYFRMSTNGRYDDVVYCSFDPDILNVRLLDDDDVTIYGTFSGMYTYETVLGSSVTLPKISVDRLEINSD